MVNFVGRIFEYLPQGGIGRGVSRAKITFINCQTWKTTIVESGAYGFYKAELLPNQYIVRVEREGFDPLSTEPALLQIYPDQSNTNLLLRRSIIPNLPHHSIFRGRVLHHWANGKRGQVIANAAITFIDPANSTHTHTVYTDERGWYQIELPIGYYLVTAIHPDFELFSSEPGLFLLRPQPTIANLFLEPKKSPAEGPWQYQLPPLLRA
jgi:hypothetical protein